MNKRSMSFKERLQWLGRMPTKWRILIGSQALFMMFAINFRLRDIERSRLRLEQQEQQLKKAEQETAT